MRKNIETFSEFSSQRIIGTIYIVIEFYAILSTLVSASQQSFPEPVYTYPMFWIPIIMVVLLASTSYINTQLARLIFSLSFLFFGLASIYHVRADLFQGWGFILVSFFMLKRYGFLEHHPILKVVPIIVSILVAVELWYFKYRERYQYIPVVSTLEVCSFFFIIVLFLCILYKEETRDFLFGKKALSEERSKLQKEKEALEKQINAIEATMLKGSYWADILARHWNLDTAHTETLHQFLSNAGQISNKEMAFQLNVSEQVVKNRMHRLFSMAQVSSRMTFLNACTVLSKKLSPRNYADHSGTDNEQKQH